MAILAGTIMLVGILPGVAVHDDHRAASCPSSRSWREGSRWYSSPHRATSTSCPEIIVALTGGLLIVADLIWPAYDADDAAHARTWPAYLGIAGLLAAAVAVVRLAGVTETLFNGIIQIDPLGAFFKLLFLGIGVLVLLMSVERGAQVHALDRRVLRAAWCGRILGSMLLASAAELFTIFLSLQLTSLPLIVLIGYAKRDPQVRRGGAEVPAARARVHGGARSTA